MPLNRFGHEAGHERCGREDFSLTGCYYPSLVGACVTTFAAVHPQLPTHLLPTIPPHSLAELPASSVRGCE